MSGTSVYGWNGYGVGNYSEAPYHYAEANVTTTFGVSARPLRVSKISSAIPLSFVAYGRAVKVLSSAEAAIEALLTLYADLSKAAVANVEMEFAVSATPTFLHFIYAEAAIRIAPGIASDIDAAFSVAAVIPVVADIVANDYIGPKWEPNTDEQDWGAVEVDGPDWKPVTDEQDWGAIEADNTNWAPVENVAWEN